MSAGHEDAGYETSVQRLTRRRFLGGVGSGLVVLVRTGSWANAPGDERERLEMWVRVDPDGSVTGLTGKVEYGQGTRTGFAQVIAEELAVPIERVRMVMGDTDRVPFDAGTFASLSTEMMRPCFQRAASRARVLLQQRAALRWNVPPNQTRLQDGSVLGPAGQSISMGALVAQAPLIDVLEIDATPKPTADYELVGKGIPRIDGLERVTGAAQYGTDFRVPNMLHGAVLRPPSWGAQLITLDSTDAATVPGFVQIVRTDGFVGVVAESESAAQAAVQRLQASWEERTAVSTGRIRTQLKQALQDAEVVHQAGDEQGAWRHSALRHEAVYETSFVYHAALEPQAAVADVQTEGARIWASTQRPFAVRQEIADLLQLPLERVRVQVTEIGGGFGRKNDADAPREAVILSQNVGRPVRVVWSRQEDFAYSSFRPAARIQIEAGLSPTGQLLAWDYCHVSSGGEFSSTRDVQSYYPSDFHRTRFGLINSGVRVGSFRGLGSPINAFARESFMDELAFAAGIDPLAFRLQALGNQMPRLTAVLRAVAESAQWKPRLAPRKDGIGFGLACCLYRGKTYVAQLAKVRVDDEKAIHVEQVTTAIDCGFVVNPDGVRRQAEGGVTMAISYCLGETIEIDGSAVSNNSFWEYPILRAPEAPIVETVFVGHDRNPSMGVGEPVTVPVAAALANAYFDATGLRLRRLPLL